MINKEIYDFRKSRGRSSCNEERRDDFMQGSHVVLNDTPARRGETAAQVIRTITQGHVTLELQKPAGAYNKHVAVQNIIICRHVGEVKLRRRIALTSDSHKF